MATKKQKDKFLEIYFNCKSDLTENQKFSYSCVKAGIDEDVATELLAELHKADLEDRKIKPDEIGRGTKEWLINSYLDDISDKNIPVDIRIRAKKEYAELMSFYSYSEDSEFVKAHFLLADLIEKKFTDKEIEYFAYGMEDLEVGNGKVVIEDEEPEMNGKVEIV